MKSLKIIPWLQGIVMLALLVSGCAVNSNRFKDLHVTGHNSVPLESVRWISNDEPHLIGKWPDKDLFVWFFRGELYALGSESASALFSISPTSCMMRKLVGVGPNGEDAHIEEKPDDPAYGKSLEKQFLKAPLLLVGMGNDYFLWRYGNRLYAFGAYAKSLAFERQPAELQGTALINASPRGETVIFEDDKNRDLATRIEHQFFETPWLVASRGPQYFVWKYRGRIYVLGDVEANKAFASPPHVTLTKADRHLESFNPSALLEDSQAYLGAGPQGETVIFQASRRDPAMVERLIATFSSSLASKLGVPVAAGTAP